MLGQRLAEVILEVSSKLDYCVILCFCPPSVDSCASRAEGKRWEPNVREGGRGGVSVSCTKHWCRLLSVDGSVVWIPSRLGTVEREAGDGAGCGQGFHV